MAYEIPGLKVGTLPANTDIAQYLAVKVAASGGKTGVAVSTLGAAIAGIVQNAPVSGEAAEVMVAGVSKAVAGATIAVGDLLASTAAGKMKVAATGEFAIAQALEAGVLDGVITVLLVKNGKI